MLDGLRWFKLGVSWGGFESLILPINDAVRSVTRWEPEGPYLRLHVGLEDPDDLIDDLAGGLARLRA
jgi:cystathionine beta-lyase